MSMVFASIFDKVLGYFVDSPEVKAAKESTKVKLAELEFDVQKSKFLAEANAEADYDSQAMRNMQTSWKDEYLILLHTFPIWGYGIPSESLHAGLDRIWTQFNSANYFWWITYIGIIASTFGLRWLFNKRIDRMIGDKK